MHSRLLVLNAYRGTVLQPTAGGVPRRFQGSGLEVMYSFM